MSDFEERLKALPRRLQMAVAVRCARRVQPLATGYFYSLKTELGDAYAVSIVDALDCATDATAASVAAPEVRSVAGGALAAAASNKVADFATRAAAVASVEVTSDSAVNVVGFAARAAANASRDVSSYDARAAVSADLKVAERLAADGVVRVDSSPDGPFGDYWPDGMPSWLTAHIQKGGRDDAGVELASLVPETEAAADSVSLQQPDETDPLQSPKIREFDRRRLRTLTTFVTGDDNQLAVEAARTVAEFPGERFNPLYIYGPSGAGKTHLLEAISSETRRQNPQLTVNYTTCPAFANSFMEALRGHTLPSFRKRFRSTDVLLVDDIEFLDNKRATQEEFFHIVTQVIQRGGQLVVSSDRQPQQLGKYREELKSRFISGLVCRIDSVVDDTPHQVTASQATTKPEPIIPGDVGPPGIYIAYDPEQVSPQQYKRLVRALGDVVRAEGGAGVVHLKNEGYELELAPVPEPSQS